MSRVFRFWRSRIAFLFETGTGGDATGTTSGSGGTSGAGAGSGAAGSGTAGSSTSGDGKSGSGSTTSTGTAPAGKTEPPQGFTYREDRTKWVPPHRIVEETTARAASDKKAADAIARAEAAEKRVRALAGVDPNAANEAEIEKVRSNFFALFPQYAKLTPELVDKMIASMERGEEAAAAANHMWDRLAQTTLRNLETRFLEVIGAEKLTDRQRAKLHGAWGSMIKADPQSFRTRYEAEDPTLIEDFIKEYTEDFVEPIRRMNTVGVGSRPPVPRGGSAGQVVTKPPQIDFTNPQAVEDYAVQRMKEAGYLTER